MRDGLPLTKYLTDREFEVLWFFLLRPKQTISRKDIDLLKIVGKPGRRSVDTCIGQIQKKLGFRRGKWFSLVPRIGYRFTAEVWPVYDVVQQITSGPYRTSILHFHQRTVSSMRTALAQSLRLLDLKLDDTAKALAAIAGNYMNLSHAAFSAELPESVVPKARQAALQALVMDPSSADAYSTLGLVSLIYDYEWQVAKSHFKKALEIDPHHSSSLLSYAHFLVSSGRPEEAIATAELAAAVAPRNQIIHASVSWMYLLANKIDMAIIHAQRVSSLFPEFSPCYTFLGWAQEARQQYVEAEMSFRKSLELDLTPIAIASLGHLCAKMGDVSAAETALQDLFELYRTGRIAYVSSYCEALVYAGLRSHKSAICALERAVDERCDLLIHLRIDRRWIQLRRIKGFEELANRVGIPTAGRIRANNT